MFTGLTLLGLIVIVAAVWVAPWFDVASPEDSERFDQVDQELKAKGL